VKILYLCQRIPYPPDRGDRIATYNQIRHLCGKHEVFVGSIASPGQKDSCDVLVKNLNIRIAAPEYSWVGRIAKMGLCLLTGKPLTFGYFENKHLNSTICSLFQREFFDAIIIFSSSMAQYVEHFDNVPRIMHFCDVDSQKWIDLSKQRHGFMRWIYRREGIKLLEYEKKLAAEYSASCVVSEREADLFRNKIPGIVVHVLENGVDAEYFAGVPHNPSGCNILFLGVMDYKPNEEAVVYFAEKIWPNILRVYSTAHFTIVGSKPTKAVQRLAKQKQISVTGHVKDIREYLSSATVMVAPLEIARGVQNKILEAMAAGLPVLATKIVSKGLPPGAAEHIFVANREPDEFASLLLKVLCEPKMREMKAAAAQRYVQCFCTWEKKLEALDRVIEVAAEGRMDLQHSLHRG
jgi:polysaccharide biosynthesis protein PslH